MSSLTEHQPSPMAEGLHTATLAAAAFGLLLGLLARNPTWVNAGVWLILVLPPLRLATTIIGEARARRFVVALLGASVLAFLLLSRKFS